MVDALDITFLLILKRIMEDRYYYYPHLYRRNGDLERLIKFLKVTKLIRGNKGLTAFLVMFYSPDFEALCYAVSLTQVCLDSLGRVLITFIYYYKIFTQIGIFLEDRKRRGHRPIETCLLITWEKSTL